MDHKSNRKKQLNTSKDRRVSAYKGNGKSGNGNKSRRGVKKTNSKTLSKMVDGKTVYAKQYSKQGFSSLTSRQRGAVISLNHEKRKSDNESKKDDSNNEVTRHLLSIQADLVSMGEAIVAGVAKATNGDGVSVITDDVPDNDDQQNDTSSNKRKATSGNIGEFICKQRRGRG